LCTANSGHGRIVHGGRADGGALQGMIDDCLGYGRFRPHGGAVLVPRPAPQRPLVVLGTPLPVEERIVLDYGERPAVLLVLLDPEDKPDSLKERLQSIFQLSPAEASLVADLACGKLTNEIADHRGVRRATVRTQLKSIYLKTDTAGQSQLAALASRIAGLLARR
ncbi:MAG: hypothetical protein KDH19_17550, partial [Geminicoccaceae bacterium]|nr:hypothetical protein [Geminicoccaceae bacterium]